MRERATRLVEHPAFRQTIVGVIVFNAITLGLQTFDPYRFDPDTVARVLDMLASGSDTAAVAAQPPAPGIAPAASARMPRMAWAGLGAVVLAIVGVVAMRVLG